MCVAREHGRPPILLQSGTGGGLQAAGNATAVLLVSPPRPGGWSPLSCCAAAAGLGGRDTPACGSGLVMGWYRESGERPSSVLLCSPLFEEGGGEPLLLLWEQHNG